MNSSYLQSNNPSAWPSVSVIIPTFNCSQSLPTTVDSLLKQEYPDLEVIAVDAGSTDRTLELLQSYAFPIRLIFSPTYQVYQMINKGIHLAKGEYINVLFPGDFYIHKHTLQDIMQLALHQEKPHLVYCGTLLRDGRSEVKFLFRQLSCDLLRCGQQPTSLQGCWLKRDVFEEIGYFHPDLQLRGGFDFFCRLCLNPKLRFAALAQALTDYDLRWVTSKMVFLHFWETLKMLYSHFGLITTVKWLGRQKDFRRFIRLWMHRLQLAFRGR